MTNGARTVFLPLSVATSCGWPNREGHALPEPFLDNSVAGYRISQMRFRLELVTFSR